MTRVSEQNLKNLAATISLYTGKTYQVGQIFGTYYSLVAEASGGHAILSAPTKGTLYDMMCTYLEGVRWDWSERREALAALRRLYPLEHGNPDAAKIWAVLQPGEAK